MLNKRIFYVLLVLLLVHEITGCKKETCLSSHDYVSMGDSVSLHYEALNPPFEVYAGHNSTQVLDIDVDSDGVSDIRFEAKHNASQAGNSSSSEKIKLLESNVEVLVESVRIPTVTYWTTNANQAVVSTFTTNLTVPAGVDSFATGGFDVSYPLLLNYGELSSEYEPARFEDSLDIIISSSSFSGFNAPVESTNRTSIGYEMPVNSLGYFHFRKETECGYILGWIEIDKPDDKYLVSGYAYSTIEKR